MRRALPLAFAAFCLSGPAHAGPQRCDLAAKSAPKNDPDCARRWMDRNLKMNDLLVVGSHNSYKRAIPANELAMIASRAPDMAPGIDYSHPSLTAELDAGARQLEIDVVYDPQGGHYAQPLILKFSHADMGEAWRAAMAEPGFKVLHIPDVDIRANCITFQMCLAEIRAWSEKHPDHVPITILINAKDGDAVPGGTKPLTFDAAAFDALDAEVRAALPAAMLITPDMVQGHYPTLRDGALHDNWPTLGQARGKILIALDETPEKVALYQGKRRSLEGRAMFVNAPDEASPVAAYFTLNDPVPQADRIRKAVQVGFLVRTRADADTQEARANETKRRTTALMGGAQMVSTDYLWPDPRFPGGYRVNLAGAAAVCNPVRTGDRCGGAVVEAQAPLGARPQ